MKFRAYCTGCGWEDDDSYDEEEEAYESLNAHVQYAHAWEYGVRVE